MSVSGLAKARMVYKQKVAAIKAQKNKSATNVAEEEDLVQTCKYCREDGHLVGYYDKNKRAFVETCPTILAKKQRTADQKRKDKAQKKQWRNQMSDAVAEEHGSGWTTCSSSFKKTVAPQKTGGVVKAKNPFEVEGGFGEDDEGWDKEEEVGVWANVGETSVVESEEVSVARVLELSLSRVVKHPTNTQHVASVSETGCGCGEWGCGTCAKEDSGVSDGW